jgi:HlyD family secretion protein
MTISGNSEYRAKSMVTRQERANQVYAVKIAVKNDGWIRIGMYGEAIFKEKEKKDDERR